MEFFFIFLMLPIYTFIFGSQRCRCTTNLFIFTLCNESVIKDVQTSVDEIVRVLVPPHLPILKTKRLKRQTQHKLKENWIFCLHSLMLEVKSTVYNIWTGRAGFNSCIWELNTNIIASSRYLATQPTAAAIAWYYKLPH